MADRAHGLALTDDMPSIRSCIRKFQHEGDSHQSTVVDHNDEKCPVPAGAMHVYISARRGDLRNQSQLSK